MAENIIRVTFEALRKTAVIPKTKLDYGQKLEFINLELPEVFEADFCNTGDAETKTVLGQGGIVQIPDEYLQTGKDILCYLYLHYTPDSGQTQYTVKIPVATRPDRTEETPTPVEQSLIEQALAALNDAVDRSEEAAGDAETSAGLAADGAELSESWAVGGTGIRPGEDTNNSKFYAEVAQQGAEYSGFAWFDVNEQDGEMYVSITTNLSEDVSFLVNEDLGILEVTYA